jgi:hypothetical protein
MPLLEYCIALPPKFLYLLDRLKSSSFQYEFQLGEEKEIHQCKVWSAQSWGMSINSCFVKKSQIKKEEPFFPLHKSSPFLLTASLITTFR